MKKKLGINVWRQIESVLKENRDLYILDEPHNQVLRLIAADTELDFFFEVGEQDQNNYYPVKYKPHHPDHVRENSGSLNQQQLIGSLETWLRILRDYATYPTPYDTSFEHFYQKEYYEQFKFVEPEAEYEPFEDQKLLMLDAFIDHVKSAIEDRKNDATDREKVELSAIQLECETLQKDLPKLSKNQAIRGISKFLGKLKKYGIKFVQAIASEAQKAIAKQIVERGPDLAQNVIDLIS